MKKGGFKLVFYCCVIHFCSISRMLFYLETTKIWTVQNNLSFYIVFSGKFGAKSARDGANTVYILYIHPYICIHIYAKCIMHSRIKPKPWPLGKNQWPDLWDIEEIRVVSTGSCLFTLILLFLLQILMSCLWAWWCLGNSASQLRFQCCTSTMWSCTQR